MVIDGIRWDFVAGPMGNTTMPVTSKLLANSSGCLLQVKLQSPTVTMPRIKVKLLLLILLFIFLEITSNEISFFKKKNLCDTICCFCFSTQAMMTGTVPNFIDIVLNFGSKPLHSDNFLLQAKKYGHKLVFYGDDTWLSLFPHMFERHDGTTSFFVTDFTEVISTCYTGNKLYYDKLLFYWLFLRFFC